MKKTWLRLPATVFAAMTVVISAAAEAKEVLKLDFSDAAQVTIDEANSQGTGEIADGILTISGWKPGSTSSAAYVKTNGVLKAPDDKLGTLTLEFEFIPRDISWTIAKVVIGDQGNGTEQDALVLEIYGNDFALEKRGMFKLNLGGVVTDLGEFNTGELMADATYAVRVYKDNGKGTAELYFYEKDGKVPAEPTLTVQSDDIKGIAGNISFTGYAGKYAIDNLAVYDGEAPKPTAPTTTTAEKPADTTAASPAGTTQQAGTTKGTATAGYATSTEAGERDGGNTALIVVLCVAAAVIVAAAVVVVILYRKGNKSGEPKGPDGGQE